MLEKEGYKIAFFEEVHIVWVYNDENGKVINNNVKHTQPLSVILLKSMQIAIDEITNEIIQQGHSKHRCVSSIG